MYKHPLTTTIATLFGAIAFVADQPTHVPPEMVRDVVAAGATEITDEVAGEKHVVVELDVLRATLADAIKQEDAAVAEAAPAEVAVAEAAPVEAAPAEQPTA